MLTLINVCRHCCVLVTRYAMLCGRPPFETSTLKETYERIAANRYTFPSHVTTAACDLIGQLLSHYPHDRPSLSAILRHEFFTSGYMPPSLNVNCCYKAPKFPAFETLQPSPRYVTMCFVDHRYNKYSTGSSAQCFGCQFVMHFYAFT